MLHPTNNPAVIPALRGAGIIPVIALIMMLFASVGFGAFPADAQDLVATPEATPEVSSEIPEFGIRPVDNDGIYFTETIEPGQTIERSVELYNAGKSDVEIITYAADSYSIVNGGFGVELDGEPVSGVTTWVDYERQRYFLPHGEGRVEPFTITVPKDTAPGEYITSLVIQTAEPLKSGGAFAIEQTLRQAIAVAITVPGEERPALELGAVTYKHASVADAILVEVRNTGNLHLKPQGTVQIFDATGATVLDVAVGMDSVYTGTSTHLEVGLTQPLPPGEYSATVQLADTNRGGRAQIEASPFTVVASAEEESVSSVTVDSLAVDLVRAADGKTVQLANVSVDIGNAAGPMDNIQVVLHVERDGELIEDYSLATGMEIMGGTTTVQQRYLPLTGWTPGFYSFSVTIESVDPSSGNVTVLATSAEPVVHDVA